MTPHFLMIGLILFAFCIVENTLSAEIVNKKKFNHAYVLQDLETYQAPSTLSYNQNYNKNPHFNQNYNSNNLDVGSYYMAPTSQPTLPTDYSSNPYLAQPAPPALNALPSNQPPMVQPASTTPSYVPQNPFAPPTNEYGPHLYSAPASQYTGPQLSITDLQNSPVIILVKNPDGLSYDMAYASSGLSNLDRDVNSQLIAKLLLRHSDKVGILYPTNGFPINSFPDFRIGNLILPQDISLSKFFNFYPRYVPILFLYSNTDYQKVGRETKLSHLGQYKYK